MAQQITAYRPSRLRGRRRFRPVAVFGTSRGEGLVRTHMQKTKRLDSAIQRGGSGPEAGTSLADCTHPSWVD